MHRFINTFLFWLLVAALPLQGMAAMQLSCGPTKHHAPASAASHDRHHHASPGQHHDSDAQAAAPSASTEDAAMSGHATLSCSACSTCCVGAIALPVTPIVAPVYSASLPALPASPLLLADFIPAGLERPPKPLTA
jgi:hypothetical protein